LPCAVPDASQRAACAVQQASCACGGAARPSSHVKGSPVRCAAAHGVQRRRVVQRRDCCEASTTTPHAHVSLGMALHGMLPGMSPAACFSAWCMLHVARHVACCMLHVARHVTCCMLHVARRHTIKLIPIDHGYTLPDSLGVSLDDWVWASWPQVSRPAAKTLTGIPA